MAKASLSPSQRSRRVAGTDVLVVKEGAPGGMRKLRCPTTHAYAVPAVRKDGQQILRTPGGVEYVFKKF